MLELLMRKSATKAKLKIHEISEIREKYIDIKVLLLLKYYQALKIYLIINQNTLGTCEVKQVF